MKASSAHRLLPFKTFGEAAAFDLEVEVSCQCGRRVVIDGMAPAFPAGSNALYERHKGELVAGGYYIFRTRRPGKPTQLVRRFLQTTPTGRIAVEMFKDATGKPHRAFLEPDQWHAYYRIVRRW